MMLKNMGAASTIHVDVLWWRNTLKRRPQHCTLYFYTKVQVWGMMVRTSSHVPFTPKTILVKKKKMSALSCYKKRVKKERDL